MHRRGITLVEIVLGILLLGVGGGLVARDIARGLTRLRAARQTIEAVQRAEAGLDAFLARPCSGADSILGEALPITPSIHVRRRCR